MAKRWIVEGRIRADIHFKRTIEAPTEKAAVQKAENAIYRELGISESDVIDDEIYCERIKEWGTK